MSDNPEKLPGSGSSTETIEDIKEQLAEMYLNFLDKKKWWIIATWASLGVNLNPLQKDAIDYMITDEQGEKDDILTTIGKNIKKKFIEKATWWTPLEYDQASLTKMKSLIMQYKNDQVRLQDLMSQIQAGTDPTIAPPPPPPPPAASQTETQTTQKPETQTVSPSEGKDVPPQTPVTPEKPVPAYVETQFGKREDVLGRLDKVVDYDKEVKDIRYTRWGRNSVKEGLDCSGLIIYTLHQAGLEAPGGDSRSMFEGLKTEKLEMDDKGWFANIEGYKPGDIVFRDAKNPKYDRKESSIPTIRKDGKKFRIHHMAFIKEVDPAKGKLTIVESNGSQGVVERELSYKEVKEASHKSDLYAGKVEYDSLLAYNAPKGQSENLA